MKNYLKTAIVLAAICAVAAVLLAFANKVTEPAIQKYEEGVVLKALQDVACGYDIGSENKTDDSFVTSYYTLSKGSDTVGYILNLKSNGYGGEMTIAASFEKNGSIMNVKMVSNSETPGVGKKSEKEGYMDMFLNKGYSEPVPTSKNMLSSADSAAVSGATMTFNGISKALSYGSEFVKKLGGAQ